MQLGTNAAKAPINPGTYNDILNIVGNAPNFSIDGQWYSMNVLPDPMSPKKSRTPRQAAGYDKETWPYLLIKFSC